MNVEDEDRIREFVNKKLEERTGLLIHSVFYTAINILCFAIWLVISRTTDSFIFPWFLVVPIPWGIVLYSQYTAYSNKYGHGRDRREQLIQEEINREWLRGQTHKRKNEDVITDRRLRADDGIIEFWDEDALEDSRQLSHKEFD